MVCTRRPLRAVLAGAPSATASAVPAAQVTPAEQEMARRGTLERVASPTPPAEPVVRPQDDGRRCGWRPCD